jgi:hypothetical protein
MFTMVTESTRRTVSAVAAVAVVAFSGVAFEAGHAGALPQGSVEVGELTPVNLMQMVAITLPEVVITGQRVDAGQWAANVPMLPEVVVVASREVQLAAVPSSEPAQG